MSYIGFGMGIVKIIKIYPVIVPFLDYNFCLFVSGSFLEISIKKLSEMLKY